MEVKEQTVIISLDDIKDNQENYYSGGNNNGGTTSRDRGIHRRPYYNRYNGHTRQQGHNNHHHHYNNGYNNSHHHNNGYNNGQQHNNGYGGGGQRTYGNKRHYNNYYSYPPNGQGHSHQLNCDTGGNRGQNIPYDNFQPNNHRYFQRDPTFDISPQNQIQFPPFFPPGHGPESGQMHGPPPPGGQLNSLFNPRPHFMFPDLQIPIQDPPKGVNGPDSQRSMNWSYDSDKLSEENCVSASHIESPGPIVQNGQGNFHGQKKRSVSPAQFENHMSGPPPFIRRPANSGAYNNRTFYFDNRWNWNPPIRVEELIDKYHYVEESEKPEQLAPNRSDYEKLSEQIWTKFQTNQQTLDTYHRKLELWRELVECVAKYNPMYRLEVVGSTLSGFGSNTSDMDMCLILNHRNESDPRSEAIDILEAICPVFELIPNLIKKELILAKVPILKLRETEYGIDIDINVNNAVGIRNTHLLHAYTLCDWRVRPLVLVVKLWAHAQGINDAKLMTLSSYSLALMVIHYLQHGVSPPVLPCLQLDNPSKFSQVLDLWKLKKADPPIVIKPENTQSLGELLVGFLEYFSVRFENSAISVRIGSTMSIRTCSLNRATKNDAYQWKHICIEEPFEFTNTARSVFEKESYDRIRGVFFASWQRLTISHDLDTIFQMISPGEARTIGSRVK